MTSNEFRSSSLTSLHSSAHLCSRASSVAFLLTFIVCVQSERFGMCVYVSVCLICSSVSQRFIHIFCPSLWCCCCSELLVDKDTERSWQSAQSGCDTSSPTVHHSVWNWYFIFHISIKSRFDLARCTWVAAWDAFCLCFKACTFLFCCMTREWTLYEWAKIDHQTSIKYALVCFDAENTIRVEQQKNEQFWFVCFLQMHLQPTETCSKAREGKRKMVHK